MKINLKYLFNDQEFEKQYINMSRCEKENITFLDVLKNQDKQNKKKFNVYEIAAKIARGEVVSGEELKYIKENAPSLYREALMVYEKNKKNKMNKNNDKNLSVEDSKYDYIDNVKCELSDDTIRCNNERSYINLELDEDDSIRSILQIL